MSLNAERFDIPFKEFQDGIEAIDYFEFSDWSNFCQVSWYPFHNKNEWETENLTDEEKQWLHDYTKKYFEPGWGVSLDINSGYTTGFRRKDKKLKGYMRMGHWWASLQTRLQRECKDNE